MNVAVWISTRRTYHDLDIFTPWTDGDLNHLDHLIICSTSHICHNEMQTLFVR